MAIAYIYPPTNETVEKERWRWGVLYTDGTTLDQFEVSNGQAVFHRFGEIDHSRVYKFSLVHDTYKPVYVYPPEGAKLVHFYVTGIYNIQLPDGEHIATVKEKGYKFGYTLNKQDIGVLIEHDDSIRIINNFKEANLASSEGTN